eukprot:scaffold12819_cov104-Skeletonema_dohrnii-CCMP3373.AAC.5
MKTRSAGVVPSWQAQTAPRARGVGSPFLLFLSGAGGSGCTNIALRGGVCITHGAKKKYAAVKDARIKFKGEDCARVQEAWRWSKSQTVIYLER